ncbi:MAG: hypothetical protein ABSG65_23495 [Bryobacteraceae bacterium]|jgi:hypothetical protein
MIFLYGSLALLLAAACLFSVLALQVAQARRASKTYTCRYCGSHALHVSSPGGMTDRLLKYWNCVPHRCEVCFHRHYRLAEPRASDDL